MKKNLICALLLSLTGTAAVSAKSYHMNTAKTRHFSTPQEYQREFAYGYEEGRRYAARNDRAGYQYMLQQYRNFWAMYPSMADFYRGRIDGLTAGFQGGQLP